MNGQSRPGPGRRRGQVLMRPVRSLVTAVAVAGLIAGAGGLCVRYRDQLAMVWRTAAADAGRWWAPAALLIGAGVVATRATRARYVARRDERLWLLRQQGSGELPGRPIPGWLLLAGAVVVIAAGAVALQLLLHEAGAAPPAQRAQLRIDAVKTAFTFAAGASGAGALLIAGRNLWMSERDKRRAEQRQLESERQARADALRDNAARRFNEALERVASQDPMTRVGGLHGLESVGQDHPMYRQQVVDLVCAYLRQPHAYGDQTDRDRTDGTRVDGDPIENVVRASAQAILIRHLRLPTDLAIRQAASSRKLASRRSLAYRRWHPPGQPHLPPELTPEWDALTDPPPQPPIAADPADPFWPGINVNLRCAELVSLDLSGCQLADADFSGAQFRGVTSFDWAAFGHVNFTDAAFRDRATFTGTMFRNGGHFTRITAMDATIFQGATFAAKTYLDFNDIDVYEHLGPEPIWADEPDIGDDLPALGGASPDDPTGT